VLQLEKVRLDAETTLKRLEAEGALARAAAAQTEAAYKADRAAWVTSLDAQKFEVNIVLLLLTFVLHSYNGFYM
jgi:hypothetical protein